ncbi:MAG TPA: TIGR03885 family FMN-dependent LLM class oxidoreductase [Tepidisphaeraceae bacterium]
MAQAKTLIGYHASHEQFPPSQLLQCVQRAEQAGFNAAMCSDHFNPWGELQGQSGFAWSWLGAALQSTRLSFGMVNAPGQRYHPAIIAQAAATLAEMFPDRVWCAFGSGQLLNEYITGQKFPTKPQRNQRLKECIDVIRALWRGETVNHHSEFITVEEATLYTRPKTPPMIFGAALSTDTARFAGSWADALITVHTDPQKLKPIVAAFREGGGEGKPMALQVHLAYAPTDAQALEAAHSQWRNNTLPSSTNVEIKRPDHFDVIGKLVQPESMRQTVLVSSDIGQHIAWLQEYRALGFDRLYLHEVGKDQNRFIDTFGEKVLPQLS